MTQPLIATGESDLVDALMPLAAAAGVDPLVTADLTVALGAWPRARVVLVGPDLAEVLVRCRLPRREDVYVVTVRPAPPELFRTALDLQAGGLLEVRRSESWLVEKLGAEADGPTGVLIGVVGGSGGAGASTFACALGKVAAREDPALVVDADPLGPGLDRVLGLDQAPGVRWDALCHATGRLSARSLREALPRRENLGVLTWPPGSAAALQPFAVREALSAARRGHETVVVDLPRTLDPMAEEVVSRCDLVVMVVVATVAGVASATRLAARLADRSSTALAVRGRGIDPDRIAGTTGLPLVTVMGDQRGLAEAIDLGFGPVRTRRSPLGRAAREVLTRASVVVVAA